MYTTDKLDREVICPYLETCVFSFETAAQSTIKSFFTKISVNIFIDESVEKLEAKFSIKIHTVQKCFIFHSIY
jgi:hypothetical protein